MVVVKTTSCNQERSQNAAKVMHIKGRLPGQAVIYSIAPIFKMWTSLNKRELIRLNRENVREEEASVRHKEEFRADQDQKENYEIILIR